MGISQLTAFCGIHGGQFLFLSQTIPTSLSLRHLLFNLFRHVNQAKSVEHPINVGHTPDIPQRLGSVHYLSDFTDIVIRQQHGTPSKALAALSPVNPQFLGELISPALLRLIGKGQAGQGLELVAPKSHHALPEVLLAGILLQRNHSSVVALPLCSGADIGSVSCPPESTRLFHTADRRSQRDWDNCKADMVEVTAAV